MRRALAGQILRLLVWLTRNHKPVQMPFHSAPTCAQCHEYWPCTARRETDERVERFAHGQRQD